MVGLVDVMHNLNFRPFRAEESFVCRRAISEQHPQLYFERTDGTLERTERHFSQQKFVAAKLWKVRWPPYFVEHAVGNGEIELLGFIHGTGAGKGCSRGSALVKFPAGWSRLTRLIQILDAVVLMDSGNHGAILIA